MTHEPQRGIGALVRTDVEHVELGEHRGRRLGARVEHRRLQIALGRRASGGVTLGRRRVRAVEVRPEGGVPYAVEVPAPPDPWQRTARWILATGIVAWAISRLGRRLRHRSLRGDSERI